MSLEEECIAGGMKFQKKIFDWPHPICIKSRSDKNDNYKSDCKWCGNDCTFLFVGFNDGIYRNCFYKNEFDEKCKLPRTED